MILADFGAEVIVIDGPPEDPLLDLPASPMWRRGENLVELDLDKKASTVSMNFALRVTYLFVMANCSSEEKSS